MPITPNFAWNTVMSLLTIDPLGKFESTVHQLKIHYTPNIMLYDITIDCQLGGVFALRGPTPLGLVTQLAPALLPVSAIPNAAIFQLPQDMHPSPATLLVANWRE
jgi:hypothetical protein